MSDPTNERKIEHIRAIEKDPAIERGGAWFDRIHLRHRALPNHPVIRSSPAKRNRPATISSTARFGPGAVTPFRLPALHSGKAGALPGFQRSGRSKAFRSRFHICARICARRKGRTVRR
jgi:hypothetical protein